MQVSGSLSQAILKTQTSLFKPCSSKTIKTHAFGTTIYRTYDDEVSKNFQSIFFKDFGIEPLRFHVAENLWGNGIVVSDGKTWADVRSFIRSSFDIVHTKNIERSSHHVDKFMKLLPRDGSTVDMMPLFKRLILDTSSEFLFGESLNALDEHSPVWFDACKQVTDFCDTFVTEAIARVEEGEERYANEKRLRLIDEAVKSTKDRYTLRSLILSVFSPAHDGAAVALSNTFFHLSRHPRVWSKLREEVMESSDEPITYDLLNSYQYLKDVFREVTLNQRAALKDVILLCGGVPKGNDPLYVQKGDIIDVDYRTMMRDSENWGSDANQFRPERWREIRPTWEYTPFGGGPRACPGIRLVYTEIAYTVVKIIRDFTALNNRDEEDEWQEKMRWTFQSKNGTKVGWLRT
ncbi:cytochrome P450 [Pleomassaria siparia CBS 279.74]|uniref:Cytochrome P450 n=1 Tax=Pleomassaria siparia CBS 279.74 TaxID=1314801 RepID=A0A6G1KNZ5_9PLEO|nr:cytochrome P450 [Pleomassaria siparia CBS 279.74]